MIESEAMCAHCGGAIAIRNPRGDCDHLHWPGNLTDEAKVANGYRLQERIVTEWVSDAAMNGGNQWNPCALAEDVEAAASRLSATYEACMDVARMAVKVEIDRICEAQMGAYRFVPASDPKDSAENDT